MNFLPLHSLFQNASFRRKTPDLLRAITRKHQSRHHRTICEITIKASTIVPSISSSCSFSDFGGMYGRDSPWNIPSGTNSGFCPCNLRDLRGGSAGTSSWTTFSRFFFCLMDLAISAVTYHITRTKKKTTASMCKSSRSCFRFSKAALRLSA